MVAGSTFSGLGGFDLGIERAGFSIAYQIDNDPFCQDVLKHHWPNTPKYLDIRDVDGTKLPQVDLLFGGFPCTETSIAGKRTGLEGENSGLFYEFVRLAKEVRPKAVLIENVPGVLSTSGGRVMDAITRSLAELGMGFAHRIFDSKYFGIPQSRRRIFIVGFANRDWASARKVLFEREGGGGCPEPGEQEEHESASRIDEGIGAGRIVVAKTITAHGWGRDDVTLDTYVVSGGRPRRLMPVEVERLFGLPDDWSNVNNASDAKRYSHLGNCVVVPVAERVGRRVYEQLSG